MFTRGKQTYNFYAYMFARKKEINEYFPSSNFRIKYMDIKRVEGTICAGNTI